MLSTENILVGDTPMSCRRLVSRNRATTKTTSLSVNSTSKEGILSVSRVHWTTKRGSQCLLGKMRERRRRGSEDVDERIPVTTGYLFRFPDQTRLPTNPTSTSTQCPCGRWSWRFARRMFRHERDRGTSDYDEKHTQKSNKSVVGV